MTTEIPITVIQISDLHILAEKGKTISGVDTDKTFKQSLAHIHNNYKKIDLLLATGDLAEDPKQSTYQRIYQAFKQYKTRTLCLPGNHDDLELMQKNIADDQVNCDRHIKFKYWQVINLNSKKKGSTGGQLGDLELTFLNDTLKKHPNLHTLITVHHHPIPTGSQWMDTMMIEDTLELFSIVKKHPQVKAISCGHIHQELEAIKDNTLILGVPSCCFQFKPYSTNYALDDNKPGYRSFSLHPDGSMESKVIRLLG